MDRGTDFFLHWKYAQWNTVQTSKTEGNLVNCNNIVLTARQIPHDLIYMQSLKISNSESLPESGS